jgi:hypothetical protein
VSTTERLKSPDPRSKDHVVVILLSASSIGDAPPVSDSGVYMIPSTSFFCSLPLVNTPAWCCKDPLEAREIEKTSFVAGWNNKPHCKSRKHLLRYSTVLV